MKLSRNELASVRARQKLRFNTQLMTWEVYTFVEPNTNDFKWYAISDHLADWYKRELHLPVVAFEPPTVTRLPQPIAT